MKQSVKNRWFKPVITVFLIFILMNGSYFLFDTQTVLLPRQFTINEEPREFEIGRNTNVMEHDGLLYLIEDDAEAEETSNLVSYDPSKEDPDPTDITQFIDEWPILVEISNSGFIISNGSHAFYQGDNLTIYLDYYNSDGEFAEEIYFDTGLRDNSGEGRNSQLQSDIEVDFTMTDSHLYILVIQTQARDKSTYNNIKLFSWDLTSYDTTGIFSKNGSSNQTMDAVLFEHQGSPMMTLYSEGVALPTDYIENYELSSTSAELINDYRNIIYYSSSIIVPSSPTEIFLYSLYQQSTGDFGYRITEVVSEKEYTNTLEGSTHFIYPKMMDQLLVLFGVENISGSRDPYLATLSLVNDEFNYNQVELQNDNYEEYVIQNVIEHDNNVFLVTQRTDSDGLSYVVEVHENAYHVSFLQPGISPYLQINLISLLISAVYIGILYYRDKRVKQPVDYENKQYPKLDEETA